MSWFFVFFFISGFCSVLYELVWLRLSMAQFGVTTALVSIVLSTFMAGLGTGSWAAGVLVCRYGGQIKFSPLRLYAFTELFIGVSALLVPVQLVWGHRLLESAAAHAALSSTTYYFASGAWLALTLIPWCACMGATIPLAMSAIRTDSRFDARRSFSFLYLSNVLGAVLGSFVPLFFVELYGFHATLRIGASLNVAITAAALAVAVKSQSRHRAAASDLGLDPAVTLDRRFSTLLLLFTTGFATMGMEIIWIRLYTPYIGPIVYSFAFILIAYLLATYAGSQAYRFWSRRHANENLLTWISLALLGLLPLLTTDTRVPLPDVLRVFLGVMPVSGMIGFLTPMLVDRSSGGDPDRAGRAYAVNVLGCILGPLVSGFLLLPLVGEHYSMLFFVLPWFVMALAPRRAARLRSWQNAFACTIIVGALAIFFLTKDYETQYSIRKVLRDSTATVIAHGTGMDRRLLVNGQGMTQLTPITKMMAHLTLASLDHEPRGALVICFGMGTTFRSVVSWGMTSTAVELVPSVPKLFTYYHPDGAQVLASPLAHVLIDDGRRYLERTPAKYDAIIIDPPPPVQTAGSSLLYSQDFYAVAKQRLEPGGILQQWLPEGDNEIQASVARALKNSFPYVRIFHSVEGWGWHFLASDHPIPGRTADELLRRMPAPAIADMMEWGPAKTPAAQFELVLSRPIALDQLIALSPSTPALQDDRPINEYFFLRTPFDRILDMD
ncbi:MAG: fused MFS/spermidine synthase [Candidatus Acidiferrales bacterium]